MPKFIHEDFLLHSEAARKLYHQYAESEAILDYHCHLSAKDIAENRRFSNLFEIWLDGDHYKWRAMRANGIEEEFCTGDATPYEKFLAWARTVPYTLRNPLYHWTHLELARYFGIHDLLSEETAPDIWKRANAELQSESLTAHGILKKFRVAALCTTDDPADDLSHHKKIAGFGLSTRVYPTFRPDRALQVHLPDLFNQWVEKLAAVSNTDIRNLGDFMAVLKKRHDFFHEMGCRVSDHGMNHCYADCCTEATASSIFEKVRGGKAASSAEQSQFASFMMLFFGFLDAEKGWTKQLHLCVRRNNNTRMMKELGPDTGFDSIGDWPQGDALSAYLDRLCQEDKLPKTVIYNLNPADNYLFASMIGNFQDSSVAGKIQFGSGWWFLDQKDGIELQISALSHVGLLSRFIGMLTDSRSFMSYCRHEYFRRVLCNVVGNDMNRGELPDDEKLVGTMIRNICFNNARQYLGLALDQQFMR
jgi:glucuronate isomerase